MTTEEEAEKVIVQIGKQLAACKTCPPKSNLLKLLKQATSAFEELKKQSESLKNTIKPLSDSLIKHGLLNNKDKEIRLFVGICLVEVMRILAENPDFSIAVFKDIFILLLSIFGDLGDTASPYFFRRLKLLETVAKLQFCLVMLDAGRQDLILKMFKCFFSILRDDHPQSLINSMSSIMTSILEEQVEADPHSFLDVILPNIIKEKKGGAAPSFRLAVKVIENSQKLERCICLFLKSCILNRDAIESVIKESYHDIILELYQIDPEKLLSVIPCLTHELLTDQVDVRIKALNLIRKFLALHWQHVARENPQLIVDMLNRLSDKSTEVRLAALSCAKELCQKNPLGRESHETLSAIQGRLLDHDDKVRTEAVHVMCELAKVGNFKSSDLIAQAAERLRDKKISVRSKVLKKLVEVYHDYCKSCAEGITVRNEHLEEIPCKVLMLCYEKDCQEFRPQCMELVLAELFPTSLSIEETTRHWILMFSLFKPPHLKALQAILHQKRRLRIGLRDYLDLWNQAEENGSVEAETKMEDLIRKMSSCFPDSAKAKDCFEKLKELKGNGIFSLLWELIEEGTKLNHETMKDVCLRELGDWKALSEFFHLLSRKCSFNIFGSEHVQHILDCLHSDEEEKKHLKSCQVQLLLTIISAFPSLLRGSEKKLLLIVKENPFNEQLIEVLARAGSHMSIIFRDIYSSLKRVCLEGTRTQSKLAVSAIAALAPPSERSIFSGLCQTLVNSLCNGENAPTVLQSLGCIAQHSISTFEAQEKVITRYIVEEIFRQNDVLPANHPDFPVGTSSCCSSCKLKVYALKALVRSFLPTKHTCRSCPVSFLLDIIQQMLQESGFTAGSIPCEHDKAFIRLAAAKSILRLSRKWDLHISPEIFRLAMLVAKDHSPGVRRSFATKIHKLLTKRAVPSRYVCAFSFVALDSLEDLRSDALKYLEEFIRGYGRGAQTHETMTMQGAANHPVYLVVFLIHVLAHGSNFPAPDCRDVNIYAQFVSPLFVTVQALVNENLVDGDLRRIYDASSNLRSIFYAIKKAEDAVDAQMTPKLHLLAEVGISILDSLNTSSMPVPRTPAVVLLPSSLYKSGSSEMREDNDHPLIGSKADTSFIKDLVSCLKIEVSQIGSSGTKHSQFYANSLRPSGTRRNKSTSKSVYMDNTLINKSKEQIDELHTGQKRQCHTSNCEADTAGREHQDLFPHHGSAALHTKLAAEDTHDIDANRNEGVNLSLLGDSVTATKPSLTQNEVIVSFLEEDRAHKCDNSYAEPSILSRTDDNVNCFSSKISKSNGKALVGKHIKLWFPIEKCYYSGIVGSFDSDKSTHQVTYETGEVDILSLDSEKWEIDTTLNKDLMLQDSDDLQARDCDQSGDVSANDQAKTLEASRYDSKQESLPKTRDIGVKESSQAVRRSKRRKDATNTSEMIPNHIVAPRRSQRRKV